MRILHLIIDHQVITRTLGIYEQVFPGCNDVIAFCERNTIKHIGDVSYKQIVGLHEGKRAGNLLDFTGYTHIIAHFLTFDMIDFLKAAPSSIHFCWEIYGGDLYSQFLEPNGYEMYYTNPKKYKYENELSFVASTIRSKMLIFKGYWNNINFFRNKNFSFVCRRVNSLQWCCPGDGAFVEEYANRKIAGYEVFNYSLSKVLGNLKDAPFFEGESLLIGSSASFSNNHLYALYQLKRMGNVEAEHIYLPLSYGGNMKYADEVEREYKNYLGDKIISMRSYMPLDDYNKVFLGLRSMILCSWRQESIGNAIMGLYLGVKLFMSNRSPLYNWLVECGFHIYNIEEASTCDLNTGLKLFEKEHNRELVLKRYNDEVFVNTLRSNIK